MEIILLPQAEEDLHYWQMKGESRILKRIRGLLADILEHPFSGIGKPEPLKGEHGKWSRRITDEHRLVYSISKTYFFYAVGRVDEKRISQLENGIKMAGFTTKKAVFRLVKEYRLCELEKFMPACRRERYMKNPEGSAFAATLTLFEGKKHEVKRMLEAVGCRIFYLRRDSIGSLMLDTSLRPGEYRILTDDEVRQLKDE